MKKAIKVIRDNMSAKQAQEAQLYGMKHEQLFPHVEQHTFEGSLGNYNVRCLKSITVRLV
jgi:hypothetical protein